MSNYHVVPLGPDWAVEVEGHIVSVHKAKEEARQSAVTQAKLSRSEVITYGKDGKARTKDSYGYDPFSPRK